MNITIKPNSNYWIANNVGSIILFILALILLGSDIPVIRWISLVIMGFTYIKGFYDYLYLNSLSWVLTAETLEIKSGIFSRSKNYIELYRINDYIEEQTFVERIFGVKRIILLSSDKTNPQLTIRSCRISLPNIATGHRGSCVATRCVVRCASVSASTRCLPAVPRRSLLCRK